MILKGSRLLPYCLLLCNGEKSKADCASTLLVNKKGVLCHVFWRQCVMPESQFAVPVTRSFHVA